MYTEEERAKWRQLVARWKAGEKVFDAGKRIEKTDATTVQRQEPVQPIKRQYGKVVDPKLIERKQQQQPVISKDTYTRKRIAEETKRTWRSDAADIAHSVGEGALLATSLINPEGEIAANAAYNFAKNVATSNNPFMQYMRYPIGKLVYGMDAKFPTLYRKIKALPTQPENGFVQISNPSPRFAFQNTGEESPIITNFTYDAPVRKHASGNWDSGFTLAIPGRKALLGKNVISTEPSDLFTYGDNIWMPVKDLTLMTGSKDEAILAQQYGYNVHTNPILQNLYEEGASPGVMFTTKSGRTLNLRKEDFHKYAKQIELDARKLFGSPTQKDVNFMNFVLQPKVKGQTYNPNTLDYLIREGIEPFGDRVGNAELRSYLLDSERWGNLLYDPATHAEANFRNSMGIVEKKDIPLNMRKFK